MRVLITGGAGFVGTGTAKELLSRNIEVAILDNFSSGSRLNIPHGTAVFEADIRNQEDLERIFENFKPTHVMHAAGDISGRLVNSSHVIGTASVNVLGGLNLLKVLMDAGTKRLVFASTAAVYGEVPFAEYVDEDSSLRPISPYGASKAAFEMLLQPLQLSRALDIVVLRYANVYGPGQRAGVDGGVVSRFFAQAFRQEVMTIFGRETMDDGGCRRDYIAIDDVVRANVLALCTDTVGTFNVSTQQTYLTAEVMQLICGLLRVQPLFQLEHPRHGELKSSGQSNQRLLQIGWSAPMTLSDGLQRYRDDFIAANESQ